MQLLGGAARWRSLGAALALTTAALGGKVALAQEGCAPVSVGDATGVFFLVLSEVCTTDLADGYAVVADLQRDDQPQELLVLVQNGTDQETRLVALVLADEVRNGAVDGNRWHVANAPPGPPAANTDPGQPTAEQPPNMDSPGEQPPNTEAPPDQPMPAEPLPDQPPMPAEPPGDQPPMPAD